MEVGSQMWLLRDQPFKSKSGVATSINRNTSISYNIKSTALKSKLPFKRGIFRGRHGNRKQRIGRNLAHLGEQVSSMWEELGKVHLLTKRPLEIRSTLRLACKITPLSHLWRIKSSTGVQNPVIRWFQHQGHTLAFCNSGHLHFLLLARRWQWCSCSWHTSIPASLPPELPASLPCESAGGGPHSRQRHNLRAAGNEQHCKFCPQILFLCPPRLGPPPPFNS